MTPSGSSSASRDEGRRSPTLLLLDTNILLRAVRPGFPWEEEIARLLGPTRVAIPSSVVREVERLVRRHLADAPAAALLAQRFPTVATEGEGDDAILALAVRERATVFTADQLFARRLRDAGRDVIVPRDRARLERLPARALTPANRRVRATVKKRARIRNATGTARPHHARRRQAPQRS